MGEGLWGSRPRPEARPDATVLVRCRPAGAADLTAQRRRLAGALRAGARPPGMEDGAVERLLLCFEELVSNALRHGRPPVEATVTMSGTEWLLDVRDAAAERPPTPAVGRDAARGGLGLYLVARLSRAHGWSVEADGCKHVWACLDFTRGRAAGEEIGPGLGEAPA